MPFNRESIFCLSYLHYYFEPPKQNVWNISFKHYKSGILCLLDGFVLCGCFLCCEKIIVSAHNTHVVHCGSPSTNLIDLICWEQTCVWTSVETQHEWKWTKFTRNQLFTSWSIFILFFFFLPTRCLFLWFLTIAAVTQY